MNKVTKILPISRNCWHIDVSHLDSNGGVKLADQIRPPIYLLLLSKSADLATKKALHKYPLNTNTKWKTEVNHDHQLLWTLQESVLKNIISIRVILNREILTLEISVQRSLWSLANWLLSGCYHHLVFMSLTNLTYSQLKFACSCFTYQWSVGIPSGIPLDGSNNSTNFTLDDVDILVHHAAFLREKYKKRWLVLAEIKAT